MSRDYKLRLKDILDAIEKIQTYIAEKSLEDYQADNMLIDSVNMNLVVIGEAARSIPDDIQAQYPDIDWRNIAGLRNIIAHEYFRLNLERLWDVIQNELPRLKTQVTNILEDASDGENKP